MHYGKRYRAVEYFNGSLDTCPIDPGKWVYAKFATGKQRIDSGLALGLSTGSAILAIVFV